MVLASSGHSLDRFDVSTSAHQLEDLPNFDFYAFAGKSHIEKDSMQPIFIDQLKRVRDLAI